MKIYVITPASLRSRKGNGVTALRWVRILRKLGHQVIAEKQFSGKECDVLIALHARKSSESIQLFHKLYPEKPLIVALTGTDLYQDIHEVKSAQKSLELANRFIVLQSKGIEELPKRLRSKARVIHQSSPALQHNIRKNKKTFDICVMGHMRPVKDPFRTAIATHGLPQSSKIRIFHLGEALSSNIRERALKEMSNNSRYQWLGNLPQLKARQVLSKCRLMVLTSKMEGGANVISEAIVASVPVISSHISGSVGLLGEDYPGFFQVGNTKELRTLLQRAEVDSDFLKSLQERGDQLRSLFDPQQETNSWEAVLQELN